MASRLRPRDPTVADLFLRGVEETLPSIEGLITDYKQKKADKELASILTDKSKENPLFGILADIYSNEDIPHDQKIAATNTILSTERIYDPFKVGREQRLRDKDFQDRYHKAISSINTDLKTVEGKEERKRLREKKDNLQKELAANKKLLRSGRQPVFKHIEDEYLKGVEDQFGLGETEEQNPLAAFQAPKIKFDANNPQHMAKVQQYEQQFGGDRQKVNDALLREFE